MWFDKTVKIYDSKLGPIITDSNYLKEIDLPRIALKWRGHSGSDEYTSFLKVNRAGTWEEFMQAFRTYAVSGQNFLFADVKGNIGQLMAVDFFPAAAEAAADFVANPNKASHHWIEGLTGSELPWIVNPDQGYLVSTNNTPIKTKPPISLFANSNDRHKTISEII